MMNLKKFRSLWSLSTLLGINLLSLLITSTVNAGDVKGYGNKIVGVAIAGSNDHTYVWYKDGTVSSGSTDDLDRYRQVYTFRK